MTAIHERSAGVIPFRFNGDQGPVYLVLHSATVRNPRAKWEFPKGGMETGETMRVYARFTWAVLTCPSSDSMDPTYWSTRARWVSSCCAAMESSLTRPS